MPRKKKRGSGQGSIFIQGETTWIRWRQNGRRRTRKFPGSDAETRKTAERALAVALLNIASGRAGVEVERPPAPPLGELADKWIQRREKTHRSAKEDRWRWNKHLRGAFGHLQPDQVDAAAIRRFIEAKLAEGLSSSTVRLLVRELSSLFSDVIEQGHATAHPVRTLPRATRRLIRPAHDPRTTPFLERKADVRRVYLALPEPVNVAFVLGALAGLRTGEALGLRWEHVDLDGRRIHVRESVTGRLKDDESRVVPILDSLLPVLKAWRLKTGGKGRVVPPMRSDGEGCDDHTLRFHLGEVLKKAGLLPANDAEQDAEAKRRPRLNWYRCTRHTFASHWVMDGRPIEKLKEILGHSTVQVTERYAHLKVDLFGPADLAAMAVDLSAPAGGPVPIDPGVTMPTRDAIGGNG
jgi:integrase